MASRCAQARSVFVSGDGSHGWHHVRATIRGAGRCGSSRSHGEVEDNDHDYRNRNNGRVARGMRRFDQCGESRSNPEHRHRRYDDTHTRREQPKDDTHTRREQAEVEANYGESCDTSNYADEPSRWASHVMPRLALGGRRRGYQTNGYDQSMITATVMHTGVWQASNSH